VLINSYKIVLNITNHYCFPQMSGQR